MAEPFVPLGELVTTHGLDGWLKLNPFNRNTTALAAGTQVFIENAGARSGMVIEASKPHKRQFLIKLEGVNRIEDAQRWIGSTLLLDAQALEALKPGQYYQFQVIGFEVVHVSGEKIGTVKSILSTAAGDLYVVQGNKKEHLIPAVKDFIEEVDFTANRMVIDPPDGLLDL